MLLTPAVEGNNSRRGHEWSYCCYWGLTTLFLDSKHSTARPQPHCILSPLCLLLHVLQVCPKLHRWHGDYAQMADPMSLGIACVALLAQIAELTKVLTDFVKAVRSARKDIQGFSKELASLEQAVSSLRDEAISVPELVKANVTQILKQCQSVTQDMQHILQKHQRKGAGFSQKLQWTLNDAAEVTKLRERLEPHKTGLQIALSAAILHQSNSVKEDTTAIRGHTSVSVAEISGSAKGSCRASTCSPCYAKFDAPALS